VRVTLVDAFSYAKSTSRLLKRTSETAKEMMRPPRPNTNHSPDEIINRKEQRLHRTPIVEWLKEKGHVTKQISDATMGVVALLEAGGHARLRLTRGGSTNLESASPINGMRLLISDNL